MVFWTPGICWGGNGDDFINNLQPIHQVILSCIGSIFGSKYALYIKLSALDLLVNIWM